MEGKQAHGGGCKLDFRFILSIIRHTSTQRRKSDHRGMAISIYGHLTEFADFGASAIIGLCYQGHSNC